MNLRAAFLHLERLRLLLKGRTPFTPEDVGTRPRNVPKMRRPGRDYEDKMRRTAGGADK